MTDFVPFDASLEPGGPCPADVPEPPDSGAALALIAAAGWPATTTRRLGGWLLQWADGFTGRANSVIPAGDPGRPLDQALAEVGAFYSERGGTPLLQVRVGTALEDELRDRGYQVKASGKVPLHTVEVQAAPLATVRERLAGLGHPEVAVRFGDLDDAWLARYGRSTTRPAAVRHVLAGPDRVALARVDAPAGPADGPAGDEGLPPGAEPPGAEPPGAEPPGAEPPGDRTAPTGSSTAESTGEEPDLDSGGPAGIGRGVLTGRWLGLAAIEVAPWARRRGLARAILAELVDWAAGEGADWAYLQVGEGNTAARHLYARLGFRVDHRYRYYTPPPPRAPESSPQAPPVDEPDPRRSLR